MKRIIIFCTTIKYLKLLEKLPEYIVPVGLGDAEYPKKWQIEKNGKNISNINKYFAEFSMFYWMWKNKIKDLKDDDLIGSCQHRYLWLNKKYEKKNYSLNQTLHSNLLNPNNPILHNNEVIQLNPIIFKKKTLFEDFKEVHDEYLLDESLTFLEKDLAEKFRKHLFGKKLYSHNMFITSVGFFKDYCEVVFPWLDRVLKYCLENNLCKDYNMRLPAFLGERFSSFWFSQFKKREFLSFARLGNFFLSNKLNKFINPLKLPFTFRQFPTIHKY